MAEQHLQNFFCWHGEFSSLAMQFDQKTDVRPQVLQSQMDHGCTCPHQTDRPNVGKAGGLLLWHKSRFQLTDEVNDKL